MNVHVRSSSSTLCTGMCVNMCIDICVDICAELCMRSLSSTVCRGTHACMHACMHACREVGRQAGIMFCSMFCTCDACIRLRANDCTCCICVLAAGRAICMWPSCWCSSSQPLELSSSLIQYTHVFSCTLRVGVCVHALA